ncbi:hypothetical protein CPT_Solomon_069 [Klebsiella phage Solomon]|uniref:Uncharacterized protein n=1 Tax=Klebsiella phage Solomon TaxID=2767583 RepID=A0A873WDI8_9CAUD|nr:hypothetical protein CPT_Solomon_069 [Klebsiella phage Solomon]
MTHEIKSGEQVIATITARQVVAFQVNIPGNDDMQSVFVPVWANTVAIDEDGAIWAYESIAEDVQILYDNELSWVDCGKVEANMEQIGSMASVADWKQTKVDLRGLK